MRDNKIKSNIAWEENVNEAGLLGVFSWRDGNMV